MANAPRITNLLSRLQDEPKVADKIMFHYWEYVRSIAARRLSPQVRRRVSASDVGLSVLMGIHTDMLLGRFIPPTTEEFRKVLITRICKRAASAANEQFALKRDVRREVSGTEDLPDRSLLDDIDEDTVKVLAERVTNYLEQEADPIKLEIRRLHFLDGLSGPEIRKALLVTHPEHQMLSLRGIQVYLKKTKSKLVAALGEVMSHD